MRSRYDLDRPGLQALLQGEPAYRLEQVWEGLYRQASAPDELTVLPKPLRQRLAQAPELSPALSLLTTQVADKGTTVKWLFALDGGASVETVLMRYRQRNTVCVSTQAGCAMACVFCATGQGGFERHLGVGEIVEQVAWAQRALRQEGWGRLANVVFMGMGEPLANFSRVWEAIEKIHGEMMISARHLTVSTVGLVPGIRRLARQSLPVNLAVSLHAANDLLRDKLVPVNRRWPLAQLAEACSDYVAASGRRLSLEWACMDEVNDSMKDALELARFARPLGAHVNVIPLNRTPGWPVVGSKRERLDAFAAFLAEQGVNVTIRRNRGADIQAACGQLAASPIRLESKAKLSAAPELGD